MAAWGITLQALYAQCPGLRSNEQKHGVQNSGGESSVLLQLVRYTGRAALPQGNLGH